MAADEPDGWRSHVFGLDLTGTFAAPGLAHVGGAPTGRATAVAVTAPEEVPGHRADVLSRQELPGGAFTIARDAAGYSVEHPFYGRFAVAADGSAIACAPDALPPWQWQRLLVGQLLPLASLLHGYEPLHASAVAIAGRAVLLLGVSGGGKTSVAMHLAAAADGAFLADDVVALEARGDGVVAHPGPPLVSVDLARVDELGRLVPGRLSMLGEADGEARVALDTHVAPGPVAAVYVLARGAADGVALADPAASWVEVLIGGTFNAYVRDADRLTRQLDVAARLADSAPRREVRFPLDASPRDVAAAILEDLR